VDLEVLVTVERAAMSRAGRTNGGDAVSIVASLALLGSATWLPWATYRTSALTVVFKSGRMGTVLVVCAVVSVAMVVLTRFWISSRVRWIQLVLGCLALLCSVAIALSKIADANRMAVIHTGWETTSYAIGAGLAIAASIGMVMASGAQIRFSGVSKSPRLDTSPEIARVG
jgi:hypothetical protein